MRRLLQIVVMAVGIAIGLVGSPQVFFAVAAYVYNPIVLGVIAAIFVGLATVLFSWGGFRIAGAKRPWIKGFAVALSSALLYFVAFYLILLRPPAKTLTEPQPAAGVEYWQLTTGSRIAYLKSPHRGIARSTPVIMLHGGPGVPALPLLQQMKGQMPLDTLTKLGFDVYYYDQVGCGFSSRLDLRIEKPYTVARHVEDLEAIRATLGSEQIVLVGISWGATLASQYMLEYPHRVARVVFESPGPLIPAEYGALETVPQPPLSPEDSAEYARVMQPTVRISVGRTLAAMNSRAAYQLIPDWEVDQWMAAIFAESYRLKRDHFLCNDSSLKGLSLPSGFGFFCQTNTADDLVGLPDPRPQLNGNPTPALILRAQCDYLSWPTAYAYRKTFPNSRLLPIPNAGHIMWFEQPHLYAACVASFLTDSPLPVADYDAEASPW